VAQYFGYAVTILPPHWQDALVTPKNQAKGRGGGILVQSLAEVSKLCHSNHVTGYTTSRRFQHDVKFREMTVPGKPLLQERFQSKILTKVDGLVMCNLLQLSFNSLPKKHLNFVSQANSICAMSYVNKFVFTTDRHWSVS
jgi:hypothetical protein